MNRKAQYWILALFFAFFSYSLIFDLFKEEIREYCADVFDFDTEKRLAGAYELTQIPELDLQSWFDGSFQEKSNKYCEENIGLRTWAVRLRNQIYFSLFSELSPVSGILVGKDNFIFENNYVTSFFGDDFLGIDSILYRTQQIAFAQQKLKTMGKSLLVVLAPDKADFFSEKIPSNYLRNRTPNTNYQAYIHEFSLKKINTINFNEWFKEIKSTAPYPLIPKGGIHWSIYGTALACDSLLNYCESTMNSRLNKFTITRVETFDKPRDRDNDVWSVMNIFESNDQHNLGYPVLNFENDTTLRKPTVLVISDSFYWNMLDLRVPDNLFSDDSQFWYYNSTAYRKNPSQIPVSELDMATEIAKTDIVILMATSSNLSKFPYGFIDNFNKAFPTKSNELSQ